MAIKFLVNDAELTDLLPCRSADYAGDGELAKFLAAERNLTDLARVCVDGTTMKANAGLGAGELGSMSFATWQLSSNSSREESLSPLGNA